MKNNLFRSQKPKKKTILLPEHYYLPENQKKLFADKYYPFGEVF